MIIANEVTCALSILRGLAKVIVANAGEPKPGSEYWKSGPNLLLKMQDRLQVISDLTDEFMPRSTGPEEEL
jgi:hypothetical protein